MVDEVLTGPASIYSSYFQIARGLRYALSPSTGNVETAPKGRRVDISAMFFLLRAALIIGVIFYFSPVRQEGGSATSLDAAGWSRDSSRAALDAVDRAGELQSLWQALPGQAKKEAFDRLMASASGLSSDGPVQASDTLMPDDLKPAWRGGGAGAGR
jgi:hypothetical protein